MRYLAMLIILAVSLALAGCGQEESKPAAPQSATPAPKPAEKAQVVKRAEQVAQVAEQAQEKIAQVQQQAQAVVQTARSALSSGQAVYNKSCISCHKLGIAGAPKTGEKAVWAPLAANGIDQLAQNAINGKGKMPAKGGNADLTDDQVRSAVEYMLEQSK